MMTLYYSRGACSMGTRVILEEVGAPYEAVEIDLKTRQQFTPEFRAVNPKGKVPALVRDDGALLTEFQATAFWLARSHPEAGLIPDDREGQTRVLELLDFIVASVHMRGFTFIFATPKFTKTEAHQGELREHGHGVVAGGLKQLSETLGGKDYLLGDYSIADAGLFYMTRWCDEHGIDMPENLGAFHRRMLERPAVRRALEAEGYSVPS